MDGKKIWLILKTASNSWLDDKANRLGAAISYYSIFSLGPLLMIALAIAGWFFGAEAASGRLFGELGGLFGAEQAQMIQKLVASARDQTTGGWAAAVSIVVLLVAATGVIVQLKDALNTIWEVHPKPGRSVRVFIKTYIISLAAVLGLGFILMASLILTTIIGWFGNYIGGVLHISEWLLQALNTVVTFGIITLLFALIFKILPDVRIPWKRVWVGAIGTAVFFTIGKAVLALYFGKQNFQTSYGTAASIIVIQLWIYYLAQILLFGAEFTKAYTKVAGDKILPKADAERTTPQEQAKEGQRPSLGSVSHA